MAATSAPSATTPNLDQEAVFANYPQFQNVAKPGLSVRILGYMERYDLKGWLITLVAVAAISGVGMLFLAKFAGAKLIAAGLLTGAAVGTAGQAWHSVKHVAAEDKYTMNFKKLEVPNEVFLILYPPSENTRLNLNRLVLTISQKPEQLRQKAQVSQQQGDVETPLEAANRELEVVKLKLQDLDKGHTDRARFYEGLIQDYKIAVAILTKAETDATLTTLRVRAHLEAPSQKGSEEQDTKSNG